MQLHLTRRKRNDAMLGPAVQVETDGGAKGRRSPRTRAGFAEDLAGGFRLASQRRETQERSAILPAGERTALQLPAGCRLAPQACEGRQRFDLEFRDARASP